ncbi:MAG: MFS transporter [Clostridium sp.]|jgi:putative MFS transporter|uniref:MFS transporter n=1 Tax=Clostridium sp. TaxID=1506 RepID=UPI0025B7AC1C|nr:MFS transporter [Clostridium sp.]MCH3964482.1 MFS transporter [Clostridium sp.]MCI1714954.1 MFS transporter [Clostridium sp.]MCI1799216.1 MFS transporter [Clostridium sp.]MCI1813137.1 MFS transporter [Clostridium sp.]MCI1870027.1 MFS transporter [Clostridium sp.]
MEEVNYISEKMDYVPISKLHYKILWLIGLGIFLDGFDVYLAGGVLGVLLKSGWSSISLNAVFISVTFLGLLIGSLITGLLGDSFGRKFSYQLNLLIFGGASLVAAFSPNMIFLIACRGIMGIGLGAEIVTGYALLAEFVPSKTRGKWVSMLSLITNVSTPAAAFLGYLIIPRFGWRWMFVFVGVFSVIVWYMRKSMPESPRWYESKGMEENAQHVVNIFYDEAEKEADNSIAQPNVIRKEHNKESGKFSDLFSKNMISRTIVGCVVLIAINTLIYTFVSWAPTFFLRKGINVSKSLGYTTIMMIGAPLGALIGSFIVDKLGRKWCLTVFMLAAGALGYAYASQNTMDVILTMGFFLTVIIYILLTLGLAIYVPELFPTDIRLRGSGFCNAVGRLATIFSPYGVAWILKNYDTRTVFIVLGCILVVVAFVIAVLGVETKQKSLDEI